MSNTANMYIFTPQGATKAGCSVYIKHISKRYAIILKTTSSFSSKLFATFHVLYLPFHI